MPEVETMFTSMKIGPKKIPVFVDAVCFTDTHHYARFMGYDKPIDISFKSATKLNQSHRTDDAGKSIEIEK